MNDRATFTRMEESTQDDWRKIGGEFAGFARYGYSKSQHRFVWGVRLVLLTDDRGLPLGYTVVPANEKEYEPLADLLTGTPAEVVIADKGFTGREFERWMADRGATFLRPDRRGRRSSPAPALRLEDRRVEVPRRRPCLEAREEKCRADVHREVECLGGLIASGLRAGVRGVRDGHRRGAEREP